MKKRALVIVAALIVALVAGEIVVRVTNVDWRYTKASLYYNGADVPAHEPFDDPLMLFRQRPGDYNIFEHQVHVNDLHHRGPDRSARKPAGVYRIIVLGGSNVYGEWLDDNQTWPARLEQQLAATHKAPIEVWNLGTPSYVGTQMARRAERAMAYEPDLILFALSNGRMRGFLKDHPVEPFFARYPWLWFDMVIDPRFDVLPGDLDIWLVDHSRFYREALIALTEKWGTASYLLPHHEPRNAHDVHRFLKNAAGKVAVGVFLCPAVPPETYERYHAGLDVPVLTLSPEGLDAEYRAIHPPAHVMEWYAAQLAPWIEDNFDLPE